MFGIRASFQACLFPYTYAGMEWGNLIALISAVLELVTTASTQTANDGKQKTYVYWMSNKKFHLSKVRSTKSL